MLSARIALAIAKNAKFLNSTESRQCRSATEPHVHGFRLVACMVRCHDDVLIVIPAQAGIFCLVEYFFQRLVPCISCVFFERTFGTF